MLRCIHTLFSSPTQRRWMLDELRSRPAVRKMAHAARCHDPDAERRRTHRGVPRVGLAVAQPRATRRPSSSPALCTSLSTTLPPALSPLPRSPSPSSPSSSSSRAVAPPAPRPSPPHLAPIPRARACPASSSTSPDPHRARLSPTPARIDPVPADRHCRRRLELRYRPRLTTLGEPLAVSSHGEHPLIVLDPFPS